MQASIEIKTLNPSKNINQSIQIEVTRTMSKNTTIKLKKSNVGAPWKDNLLKLTLGISQFNTNQNQTSKDKTSQRHFKNELDVYVCIRKQTCMCSATSLVLPFCAHHNPSANCHYTISQTTHLKHNIPNHHIKKVDI